MTTERRTPEPVRNGQRALDDRVEGLVQRIVEIVNAAGPEQRPALRDYALELLREGTEVGDAAQTAADGTKTHAAAGTNPLGIAFLLGLLALPALVVFTPIGLVLLLVALVMGAWGVGSILLRRSP